MNFDNLTSPRKSIHRDNLRREDFLVYGVTDRHWLQEGERLPDVVRKALDGGATFIQLREKQLDEADFMAEALEIQKLCREYDVPFVINDNVKIAAEIGADGVHVGQSDMEAGNVREILGDKRIIGRNRGRGQTGRSAGGGLSGRRSDFPDGLEGRRPCPDHGYSKSNYRCSEHSGGCHRRNHGGKYAGSCRNGNRRRCGNQCDFRAEGY